MNFVKAYAAYCAYCRKANVKPVTVKAFVSIFNENKVDGHRTANYFEGASKS